MATLPGRNDRCPCGSGKKFKRCCIDAPRKPRLAAVSSSSWNALSILIEAPVGVMVRDIPDAMALPRGVRQGLGAEQATELSAAVWGMPDFVCRADRRERGTGVREIGDRIIVIGEVGLLLQVKSRAAPTNNVDRESAWLSKNITKALAQARGSHREIRAGVMRLTNARERTFDIDGASLRWIAVVIVDHPNVPSDFVPVLSGCRLPTAVLLRRDWDFLFEQLKSTHAVATYLERVASKPIELGTEPLRYHDLALDDLAATPEPIDHTRLGAAPSSTFSSPQLPLNPAGADDSAHRLFRWILEDIALVSWGGSLGGPLRPIDESKRLQVLAELDRLPIGMRAEIGRYLLDGMEEMGLVPASEIQWRFRRVVGGRGTEHLAFGVGSRPARELQDGLGSWVCLRHQQTQVALKDANLTTVGVLLTPRTDARRWDTTLAAVQGELSFAEGELAELEKLWPLSSDELLR